MFISDKPVCITEAGPVDEKDLAPDVDWIGIKSKMDFGTESAVTDELVSIGAVMGGRFKIGAYNLALMEHNIIAWGGPSFEGHACTPASIRKLDPSKKLVSRVLKEINDRNRQAPEGDEKKSGSAGRPTSGAPASQTGRSPGTTTTLRSPSSTAGTKRKSTGRIPPTSGRS